MTPHPQQIVARSIEHDRIRAAATHAKPVRRLRLTLAMARDPGIAADGGYPWRSHRSMADVLRDEAGP